jgi:hypothetical protein
MLSLSISYPYLIKFHDFADNTGPLLRLNARWKPRWFSLSGSHWEPYWKPMLVFSRRVRKAQHWLHLLRRGRNSATVRQKKKTLVSRGGRHSLLLTGFFHFGRFFAFLNEKNRVSAPYKMWTRVSTLVTKHQPLSTQILKLCCMNIGAMIAYRVAGASKWVVKVAMVTLVILGRVPRYPMVRWELGRGSLFEG